MNLSFQLRWGRPLQALTTGLTVLALLLPASARPAEAVGTLHRPPVQRGGTVKSKRIRHKDT